MGLILRGMHLVFPRKGICSAVLAKPGNVKRIGMSPRLPTVKL